MPANVYAGPQPDLGPFSQRYDPNVAQALQRQIAIARLNFQNAAANRRNDIAGQGLNMMQDAFNAASPRVIASPFARAQNLLRF